MKKARYLLYAVALITLISVSVGLYLFYMPHRDIQSEKPKYTLEAGSLVNEFLMNQSAGNEKYLDQVIVVTGRVRGKETDQNNQIVLFLKEDDGEAGVRCTFLPGAEVRAAGIQIGERISVKGVVRLGASIDRDFDIVEHAIMEKCDIVQ
jgi:hypothetical protein